MEPIFLKIWTDKLRPQLSVQILRKIDLNKGEIYFSHFLDWQTNFNI